MRRAARIACWILVVYAIIIGLQACDTSRPVHRSKFDSPKHNLDKRHKRWP